MVQIGINFRSTEGYVTDGVNETHVLAGDGYPTPRDGVVFGWEDGPTSDRDYNSGIDRRLAGIHFTGTSAGTDDFRVDLDSATDHDVGCALGSASFSGWGPDAVFKDDTTAFKTAQATGVGGADFIDIQSDLYDQAIFFSSWTLQSRTFSSTILRVTNGHGTGSDANPPIAHLYVEQTGAGGGVTLQPAVGSIALAGQAATVLTGIDLAPAVGSIATAGQAVTLTQGTVLQPAVGSISMDGQAATVIETRVVAPAVGAIALVGQAASVIYGTTISVAVGTISLAGQAVTLTRIRLIAPALGTIAMVGRGVTITAEGLGALVGAYKRYRRGRRGRY